MRSPHFEADTAPVAGAGRPHLRRRDAAAICILTACTAILSLVGLGTRKVPQRGLLSTAETSAVITFSPAGEIRTVWVYPGIADGSLTVTGADGAEICSFALSAYTCFSWQTADVDLAAESLTVTLKGGTVNEVVFADAGGNAVVPETVTENGRTLFDEQETLPEVSSYENGMIFDEIYHGRSAFEILNGLPVYETTHPPLGKELIALGIVLLGMNPLGWRLIGALFGIAMVPLVWLLMRRLRAGSAASFCITAVFAADFMRFVQTRIATIDVFTVFFVLLGALFTLRFCSDFAERGRQKTFLPALLGGASFGLAGACKWSGFYTGAGFAVLILAVLVKRRRALIAADRGGDARADTVFAVSAGILCYLLVPACVYCLSWLPLIPAGSGFFTRLFRAQKDMFDYHSRLTMTHPFQSNWFTWPLDLRPVWYYMGTRLPGGTVSSIAAFGNPAAWWCGTAAMIRLAVRALRRRGNARESAVLILYASQLLPWAAVTRLTFIYHYFPGSIFALLALGLWLDDAARRSPRRAAAARRILIAASWALFIAFYPVLSGLAIPAGWASALEWLPGWRFYLL